MVTRENAYDISDKLLTFDMVEYSNSCLKSSGYYPYYMYRQSKSVGNLENVGWCKDNMDCLYNVYMMDETHSVLLSVQAPLQGLKIRTPVKLSAYITLNIHMNILTDLMKLSGVKIN